jgi:hypothetical protein
MNQNRDKERNLNTDKEKDVNADLNKQGRFGDKNIENIGQSGFSREQQNIPRTDVNAGQNLGLNQESSNLDKNKIPNKDNIGFSSGLK